jgi:hypothetical protein
MEQINWSALILTFSPAVTMQLTFGGVAG